MRKCHEELVSTGGASLVALNLPCKWLHLIVNEGGGKTAIKHTRPFVHIHTFTKFLVQTSQRDYNMDMLMTCAASTLTMSKRAIPPLLMKVLLALHKECQNMDMIYTNYDTA